MKETIKAMLKDMGYEIISTDDYYSSDPTNPTYCYEWLVKKVDEEEDQEVKKLLVPDIDRNVAFISCGNRWIPVFQISDIPYFKKEDKIILNNTYSTIVLDSDLKYFKLDNKHWPLFLLLLDAEKSIEKVMNKLNINYTLENEPIKNRINIPCYDSTYISFYLPDDNHKLKNFFKPFSMESSAAYKRYKNNIFEYLNEEEAVGNYCEAWNDETKLENIITLTLLKDYGMVPNGIFSEPFTLLDLVYHIVLQEDLKIEDREINDISKRRVRLSEWLLYKLTQQHKNNVLKKINKFYEKSILDVLNTDQRRILDDNVNPLGELSMMSRIIYNGPGGIAKESSNSKLRNLHDSYYGLISPADTPSGEAVGISQHITPESVLDKGRLVHGKE